MQPDIATREQLFTDVTTATTAGAPPRLLVVLRLGENVAEAA